MERGIIATQTTIELTSSGFQIKGGITPEQIRYLVLYWDKIVIPTNNFIYQVIPEEEELKNNGVLKRPEITFQGHFSALNAGRAMLLSQAQIAENWSGRKIPIG